MRVFIYLKMPFPANWVTKYDFTLSEHSEKNMHLPETRVFFSWPPDPLYSSHTRFFKWSTFFFLNYSLKNVPPPNLLIKHLMPFPPHSLSSTLPNDLVVSLVCRISRLIMKKKLRKVEWRIPAGAGNLFTTPHYFYLCRFQRSLCPGLHTSNYMRTHRRPPGYFEADLGCCNDYSRLGGETTPSSETAGVGLKSTWLWTARLGGNECWLVLRVAAAI